MIFESYLIMQQLPYGINDVRIIDLYQLLTWMFRERFRGVRSLKSSSCAMEQRE